MSQMRGEPADRMRYKGLAFCRCPMSASGRIVFGTLLAAVGALWLALKLEWIPATYYGSAAVIFWPLVLILIGTWIAVKTIARRKPCSERPTNRR